MLRQQAHMFGDCDGFGANNMHCKAMLMSGLQSVIRLQNDAQQH